MNRLSSIEHIRDRLFDRLIKQLKEIKLEPEKGGTSFDVFCVENSSIKFSLDDFFSYIITKSDSKFNKKVNVMRKKSLNQK